MSIVLFFYALFLLALIIFAAGVVLVQEMVLKDTPDAIKEEVDMALKEGSK